MYDTGDYSGVSWWSYYEPRWASFGLWDISGLAVDGSPEPLTLTHPSLEEASRIIRRLIT
ncbi:hypothetical protein [Arthrobacter sp. JZ12]|uniref:hypothetical protein n=1 Tax=Arthrobacter sp. JZ12 TaxID=2654190 RepID=UPI002B48AEA7|nr:hypothetical protein [Arthrobacter sp. JZ12]